MCVYCDDDVYCVCVCVCALGGGERSTHHEGYIHEVLEEERDGEREREREREGEKGKEGGKEGGKKKKESGWSGVHSSASSGSWT